MDISRLCETIIVHGNGEEYMFKALVNTAPADGQALLCARASAGIKMTVSVNCEN